MWNAISPIYIFWEVNVQADFMCPEANSTSRSGNFSLIYVSSRTQHGETKFSGFAWLLSSGPRS